MAAPIGNKYAEGNNGGRPPVYETPEALISRINEYFNWIGGEYHEEDGPEGEKVKVCDRAPERPTVTGLALFLGFDSKQSLYDYKKKEEFSYPIKRALSVVENAYENALMSQGATGAIFALKNMEWTDKQQYDHTSNGESIFKTEVSILPAPVPISTNEKEVRL